MYRFWLPLSITRQSAGLWLFADAQADAAQKRDMQSALSAVEIWENPIEDDGSDPGALQVRVPERRGLREGNYMVMRQEGEGG